MVIKTKCKTEGCDKLTDWPMGYCSAEHTANAILEFYEASLKAGVKVPPLFTNEGRYEVTVDDREVA